MLDHPQQVTVHGIDDHLGWHSQGDGKFYFGLFVENGRIQDRRRLSIEGGIAGRA